MINKMKTFFSNHPILASALSGCMMLFFLGITVFVTLAVVLGKSIDGIIKSSETKSAIAQSTEYKYIAGNKTSQNEFLVIPVKGIIFTSAESSQPIYSLYSGSTYGYEVKDKLIKASTNDKIKGVILDIESPGGTVSGSKAIYDGVRYYKDITNKPVIAHISGIGASGGYMAALPANEIIADYGSLVGSIGVIMGPFKYYDGVVSEGSILNSVTTENGIDTYYITGGTDKDFGNPYKQLSDNAKSTLQKNIDNEYTRFVDLVTQNRKITPETVTNTLGALIYENTTARELGLIDSTGNKQDVYARMADLTQVNRDDFKIVTEKQSDFWSLLSGFSNQTESNVQSTCKLCGQMLYLHGDPKDYIN